MTRLGGQREGLIYLSTPSLFSGLVNGASFYRGNNRQEIELFRRKLPCIKNPPIASKTFNVRVVLFQVSFLRHFTLVSFQQPSARCSANSRALDFFQQPPGPVLLGWKLSTAVLLPLSQRTCIRDAADYYGAALISIDLIAGYQPLGKDRNGRRPRLQASQVSRHKVILQGHPVHRR